MNIAVFGCGSLGGVIAGKLQALGRDELWVIERKVEILDAVNQRGLEVRDGSRRTVTNPRTVSEPKDIPVCLDVVILTTKSTALMSAVDACTPFLTPGGFFVTVQNGLIALDLIERYGVEKILAGCVMWGASIDAPGVYTVTARGPFVLGSIKGREISQTGTCAAVLKGVFPVLTSRNMEDVLWAKLTITASLTSLGAITGLGFGDMLRKPEIRDWILGVGREIVAVGRASGIGFTHSQGGLNINLLAGERFPPGWVKHLIIRSIGLKHRKTQSSMYASILEGAPTEIDYINGLVVQLGKEHGVETPHNSRIVKMVKKIEAGSLAPGDESFAELQKSLESP